MNSLFGKFYREKNPYDINRFVRCGFRKQVRLRMKKYFVSGTLRGLMLDVGLLNIS